MWMKMQTPRNLSEKQRRLETLVITPGLALEKEPQTQAKRLDLRKRGKVLRLWLTALGLQKGPKRSLKTEIFPPEIRPDWLKEDSVIDSLNPSAVAGIITHNKMTEALNKQNTLKEEKANKSKGGLRVDMDIKIITVKLGEDNTTNFLLLQHFLFRTSLSKPESYWDSYPIK